MTETPKDVERAGSQDPTLDTVRPTSEEVVGTRTGMFGVRGSGDTSGYGRLTRAVEMPGSSEAPFGGWFDEVASALQTVSRDAGLDAAYEKVVVHRGEITFFVRRQDLPTVARLLRDDEELRFVLGSTFFPKLKHGPVEKRTVKRPSFNMSLKRWS